MLTPLQPGAARAPVHEPAAPAPAAPPSAGAAAFAALLQQQQQARVAAAAADTAAALPATDASGAGSAAADAAPPQDEPNRTPATPKPRSRAADAAKPTSRRDDPADTDTTAAPQDIPKPDDRCDATPTPLPQTPPAAAPLDPGVLHWLAGQRREHAAADADTAVDASAIDAAAAGTTPRAGHGAAANADAAGNTHERVRLPAGAAGEFASAAARESAALRSADVTPSEPPAGPPIAMPAGAAALFAALPAATHAAPPSPVAVTIAASPTAPEFAGALGVQISVLARDGVQRAELHLNPAEMGPVSVQIVIDGSRAHVEFGADVAATRHAIEAGMPELASALRDAGFTLAGGGVSQHSRGRGGAGDDGDDGGARSARGPQRAADAAAASAAAITRRTLALGGVDVFA